MRSKQSILLTFALCVFVAIFVVVPSAVQAQGPGTQQEMKLVEKFDSNKDGWLNAEERQQARSFKQQNSNAREGGGGRFGGGRGPGGPGGRGGGNSMPAVSKGMMIEKSSVQRQEGKLYDPSVLRTVFMDFESDDWEKELEDFHNTDVEVAATLTVDGKEYPNCGIRFRGASSYGHVSSGYKRPFNVSVDMADGDQRILGAKTLNLLNGHGDESLMSTVLYSHIARQYLPAPKANFVQLVINGENWGIYTSVEQFNKDFLEANYGTRKGTRWKVKGSPRGGGGLDYRGEDPDRYDTPYEQKSGGKKAKAKLIELCRVLEESSPEELPENLEPICDVDELLWFLALDVGLINGDGYWTRASDFYIYLDKDDTFHILPHDMNEALRPPRGGGGGGGRGRGGRGGGPGGRFGGGPGRGGPGGGPGGANSSSTTGLDPFVGMDRDKPLRSKVLAVPEYRKQYLANLKTLAENSLNWKSLKPLVAANAKLIGGAYKSETRKLSSYEQFVRLTAVSDSADKGQAQSGGRGGQIPLQQFIEGRSRFLLEYQPKTRESDQQN